jgi:hypothetical protein
MICDIVLAMFTVVNARKRMQPKKWAARKRVYLTPVELQG